MRLARVTRRSAIIVSVLLLVAVGVSLLALWQRSVISREQAAVAKQNIETSLNLATAAQGEIRDLLDKGVISVSAAKLLLSSANAMYAKFTDRDQDPEIRSRWAWLLLASANSYMALQDQKKALQLSQQAQATGSVCSLVIGNEPCIDQSPRKFYRSFPLHPVSPPVKVT